MRDPRGRPGRRAPLQTLRLIWAWTLALLRRTWTEARRVGQRAVSSAEASLLGPRHAANERNLYLEGVWLGVLQGITTAFLEVFAVRLGATPFQVGLLTALPALVNVVIPIPAARLIERHQQRLTPIRQSVVGQRFVYFLVALVPFLHTGLQVEAIILLAALATIPTATLNLGMTVLIGEMVSPRDRALVVSRRSVILAGTSTLATILGGWWLDLVPMPLNYQSLFAAGAVCSLLSIRFLQRIVLPPRQAVQRPGRRGLPRMNLRRAWEGLRRQRAFLRFAGGAFFYHWGLYLPSALYSIYRIRVLGANDRWIGLIVTTHTATSIVGYLLAGRYARRRSPEELLVISSAGLALFPLLTALSPSLPPLLLVGVIGGLFGSGFTSSLFTVSLSLAPEGQRATYVALYTMLVNLAAFAAPLIGSLLAPVLGIRETLYLGGFLRLAGAAVLAAILSPWKRTDAG